MRKYFPWLASVAMLAGMLVGCGSTPEPTLPPATQTPWIIVVTATPEPEEVAQAKPTQTPWIVVSTPTRGTVSETTPTRRATTGPAATRELTETETETPTPVSATATPAQTATPSRTPKAGDLIYPAPELLEPSNNQPVPWQSTVFLKWEPVGDLAADEYYHLHLERPPKTDGQQWYGDYVYLKESQFLAEGAFLAPFHLPSDQGHGVVYWWVRVVRKTGEDENGKPLGADISRPSEKRTFITEPKPDGS